MRNIAERKEQEEMHDTDRTCQTLDDHARMSSFRDSLHLGPNNETTRTLTELIQHSNCSSSVQTIRRDRVIAIASVACACCFVVLMIRMSSSPRSPDFGDRLPGCTLFASVTFPDASAPHFRTPVETDCVVHPSSRRR